MFRKVHSALRLAVLAGALACLPALAFSQGQQSEDVPHDTLGPWKIANTLLFVVGLGYMLAKFGPPFFNARSTDIQKAIQDATGLKLDADYRYSEADRKMATLAEEINKLRAEGAAALERQHAQMQQETQDSLARIRQSTKLEIEGLREDGVRWLRAHTIQAAFAQAESQLRGKAEASASEDLTPSFVRLVERGQN
jgi:F0F1-type ATP synthase membrane subunit b/b'